MPAGPCGPAAPEMMTCGGGTFGVPPKPSTCDRNWLSPDASALIARSRDKPAESSASI